MAFININEAASISGKSIQTIRRMIKQKKVKIKQQKTPQGFNYMVDRDSLEKLMTKQASTTEYTQENTAGIQMDTQTEERSHRNVKAEEWKDNFKSELSKFNDTIQQLVDQNSKDKANFFGLIKTFQDRVITLEDQIKVLKEPTSSWWQIWK